MPTRGEAFEFLENEGVRIFGTAQGRILYVGHRSDTKSWWWENFAPLIGASRISVLDIYAPNLCSVPARTDDTVHGDVLDPAVVGPGPGLLFWDEGPEHVTREQFLPWPRRMYDLGWDVLVSCPWGFQSQGPEAGNPTEEHLWGPQLSDLMEAEMNAAQSFGAGPFPEHHGNLLGWMVHPRST